MVRAVHETLRSRGQTRPRCPPRTRPTRPRRGTRWPPRCARRRRTSPRPGARWSGSTAPATRSAAASKRSTPGGGPLTRAVLAASTSARAASPSSPAPATRPTATRSSSSAGRSRRRAVGVAAQLGDLLEAYADAYAGRRPRGPCWTSPTWSSTPAISLRLSRSPSATRGASRAIMVDEFQDTNSAAARPRRPLSRTTSSSWGTRSSRSTASATTSRASEAAGEARRAADDRRADDELPRPAEILATLDAAFGDLHGPTSGRCGPAARAADRRAAVELLLVDAPAFDDRGLGRRRWARRPWRHRGAARRAAGASLVDAGAPRPGEVALLRAVASLPVFERALQEAGFATLPVGGRGWWGRRRCSTYGAPGALANPRDEASSGWPRRSWAVVGTPSPCWRWPAPGPRGRGAWPRRSHRRGAVATRLPRPTATGSAAFCPWFTAERAVARSLGLDELLERARAAATTSTSSRWRRPAAAGQRPQAPALAAAYEVRYGRDLRGFIDHARGARRRRGRDGRARGRRRRRRGPPHDHPRGQGARVRRGFVADLGRQGAGRTEDLLADDGRVGLRLVGMDGERSRPSRSRSAATSCAWPTGARSAASCSAMTRAEERLILSGRRRFARIGPTRAPGACPLAIVAPPGGGLPGLRLRRATWTTARLGEEPRCASSCTGRGGEERAAPAVATPARSEACCAAPRGRAARARPRRGGAATGRDLRRAGAPGGGAAAGGRFYTGRAR